MSLLGDIGKVIIGGVLGGPTGAISVSLLSMEARRLKVPLMWGDKSSSSDQMSIERYPQK